MVSNLRTLCLVLGPEIVFFPYEFCKSVLHVRVRDLF